MPDKLKGNECPRTSKGEVLGYVHRKEREKKPSQVLIQLNSSREDVQVMKFYLKIIEVA